MLAKEYESSVPGAVPDCAIAARGCRSGANRHEVFEVFEVFVGARLRRDGVPWKSEELWKGRAAERILFKSSSTIGSASPFAQAPSASALETSSVGLFFGSEREFVR